MTASETADGAAAVARAPIAGLPDTDTTHSRGHSPPASPPRRSLTRSATARGYPAASITPSATSPFPRPENTPLC